MDGTNWLHNAIIYHIFIDRFAGFKNTDNWDKPHFLGGTLQGIISSIPYLKKLGITAIWISPFYKTTAYHGYHITDFYTVDPHFGTLQDIKQLVTTVHNNNMRIIADFVPNHCSHQHPYFTQAQQHRHSPYYDWFYFTKWPSEYRCFLSVKALPKINLGHSPARDHIIDAAKHWLNQGFDGFRLDHVIGPSLAFWRQFTQEIRETYPNTILIGEAWMQGIKKHELKTIHIKHKYLKWLLGAASDSLFKEYIGTLDGVLDFKFQQIIKHYMNTPAISLDHFNKHLQHHYTRFPSTFYLPTFLDNHDMDRFLFQCGNNKEKLKTAAQIQFSQDQPAILYYGTETGMTQHHSLWDIPAHGDLQARQPMNWDSPDKDLLAFYKKIIKYKKNNL